VCVAHHNEIAILMLGIMSQILSEALGRLIIRVMPYHIIVAYDFVCHFDAYGMLLVWT
jgi:hypothetical protein